MREYIDLHMHTNYSDGARTPSELLDIVRSTNIIAFSVTDHDTLEGYFAIRELLQDDDPELITGVELSASMEDGDMHILAYLFDPDSPDMKNALAEFQKNRETRGIRMVEKLNEMGIDISYDQVLATTDGSVVGRPHIAQTMYDQKQINDYELAFQKYIGDKCPAYVPKNNFTPQEAIDLIHKAGGIAVLAHPGINQKEKYLEMLVELGLDGIEAYHSNHKMSDVDRYKHLAERYRLLVTGGSDYHGREGRMDKVGSQKVPYRYFEVLKSYKEKKRG